ncbi:hypothetical protein ACROYT_G024087 [Oculina patagonica]
MRRGRACVLLGRRNRDFEEIFINRGLFVAILGSKRTTGDKEKIRKGQFVEMKVLPSPSGFAGYNHLDMRETRFMPGRYRFAV